MKFLLFKSFASCVCLFAISACFLRPHPIYRHGNIPTTTPAEHDSKEILEQKATGSVDCLDRYLGVPYKWGGESMDGFDCSGLTQIVFRDCYGKSLPRTSAEQYSVSKRVKKSMLRPGDLVFFCIKMRGPVDHVGIFLGDNQMLHASPAQGVSITSLEDPYWKPRFRGARRL